MPRRPKKDTSPMGVGQCSLCDEIRLTLGNQNLGGVRYCRDCLTYTLGWVQMTDEEKEMVGRSFDTYAQNPTVIALLTVGEKLTPDQKKNMSIGESRNRLVKSMIRGEQ